MSPVDLVCATCGRRFAFSISVHELTDRLACPRCHSTDLEPDLDFLGLDSGPPRFQVTLIDDPSVVRRRRARASLRLIEGGTAGDGPAARGPGLDQIA